MKVNTYTSPFGTSHQESFKLADRVSEITPEGLNHVFFVNSGSEAVDTALKITMAYHSAVGENRHRFVSRERAYLALIWVEFHFLEWLIMKNFPYSNARCGNDETHMDWGRTLCQGTTIKR